MEKKLYEKPYSQQVAEWEAKAGGSFTSSSGNYNYKPDNNKGCWSTLWKIIKWIFIILVVIIVLALIFGG